MEFELAARLGALLSKSYAGEFFTLLVTYQDVSASEAASRLNLHISTAQDFLEGLTELEVVTRQEVHERKRPYYRYALSQPQITLEVDLAQFQPELDEDMLNWRIREQDDHGALFSKARGQELIGSLTTWTGRGRGRQEHRLNLTNPQGTFLYHLPLPDSEPVSVGEIMRSAGVDPSFSLEILDLVQWLERYGVIEFQ